MPTDLSFTNDPPKLSLKCHYKLILKPFHVFYNEILHVSTKKHPRERVL